MLEDAAGSCSSCEVLTRHRGAAGKFADYGIDDEWVKEVGEKITPGNLSLEDEQALRDAFGAAA
ncbi:hypothetical protein [Egicoccus sp. AB-alg2]|uniref:hypothetical protein n=1 Tax=Egicoccus sp. AB-alg2 TaxID=3242693 RepID=UPI00359ECA38